VLYNEQLDDYIHQIQFSLWITGRQWCDFISFDSRAPIGLQLHVHRVERDEVAIAELKERAGAMDVEADRIAELLRTKMETK
jgi:exodeoxyribonuclease (lambda-induced)